MADYILYLIARLSSAVLSFMPIGTALAFGRFFGSIAYFVSYKRAMVAYSNMRAAFCGEKRPKEMRRIVKGLYGNFGETLVEVLRIPSVGKSYIDRYVAIENKYNFDKAYEKRRGVIFLTGHFGNWELSSIASAFQGLPLLVLAREQKMKRLNDALNKLRESKGCKVVKKGMATREIYEHLGKNGIVGILSDQDAGKKGTFVRFFDRPTSSHKGAFTLARKTGAVIIPTFMTRIKGAYHKLILESPIEIPNNDESYEYKAMQDFTSVLEKHVRECPEQWLWLHKRWKSTPLRKVVIFNDGKKGHLNQSLAIYEKVKECRGGYGYGERDTELKIIDVKYKTEFHKVLLALSSGFAASYAEVRMGLLRFCLCEDTYRELERSYADIVISCGSRTAAVNHLFSRENGAKNVIIMKPSLISTDNFSLAIIPAHDNPPKKGNIVKTMGAPNLISPKRLENGLEQLERAIKLEGKKNIGFIIGGESKNHTLGLPLIKEVMNDIIGAAEELDANILATTSRRTSDEIDKFVRNELARTPRSKLIIIAKEENPEWAMAGILAASSVVVVSGDSSSMVSEAASSGRHVLVFKPEKKTNSLRHDKHEIFLGRLESDGILRIAESNGLKDAIVELADSDEEPQRLDDDEKILEAVKRII